MLDVDIIVSLMILFLGTLYYDVKSSKILKITFLVYFYIILLTICSFDILLEQAHVTTWSNLYDVVLFFIFLWVSTNVMEFINIKQMRFEFYVLILFAFFSLALIIDSNHFLSLYVAIELFSTCIYLMIAFYRKNSISMEASFKYFVMSALSTGFLIYGLSWVYGYTALLGFEDLNRFVTGAVLFGSIHTLDVGIFFIYLSLFIKLAAAPVHSWIADVYEGSMNTVMIFLALISKLPYILVLYKITYEVLSNYTYYTLIFIWVVSISSLVLGALGAIEQYQLKRFFAYSGINHLGYILIALAINSETAINISIFYIFIYSCASFALFTIYLQWSYSLKKGISMTFYSFSGYFYRSFTFSIFWILILFSYIGLPPLTGFYAKYVLFYEMILQQYYIATLFALMCSMFSVVYYIRFIKIMYFKPENINTLGHEGSQPYTKRYKSFLSLCVLLLCMIIISIPFFWDTLSSSLSILSVRPSLQEALDKPTVGGYLVYAHNNLTNCVKEGLDYTIQASKCTFNQKQYNLSHPIEWYHTPGVPPVYEIVDGVILISLGAVIGFSFSIVYVFLNMYS